METNSGTGNENLPPPTLCRTGCGFYGNSQFDGMCSKCYKDTIKRRQQNTSPSQLQGPTSQLQGHVTSSVSESRESSVSSVSQLTSSISVGISPDVETASPTVPSTSASHDKVVQEEDESDTTAAAGAQAAASDKDSPDKGDKKPKKNRCHTCKKKLGLTGFECRCGGLYCGLHRYSDKHDCTFNYKEMAQEQIRKANPVVVGAKIQKI